MNYNISYDIAALLLSAITFAGVRLTKDMNRRENVIFSILIAVNFATAFLDILSAYCIMHPSTVDYIFTDLAAYMYIIIHNMLPFLYYLYVLQASSGTLRPLMSYRGLQIIPLLCSIVMIALQPFFHQLYIIGSDGVYYRQPLLSVLYLNAAIYIMLGSGYAVIHNWRLTSWRVPMFLGYTAATGVAIILQVLWPSQLIEVFCQTLAFIVLMYTIEDSESIYDAKEKLYNRKGFLIDMEKHFSGREPFGLIMVRFTNIGRYASLIGSSALYSCYIENLNELIMGVSRSKWYDLGNYTFAFDIRQRDTRWINSFLRRVETKFRQNWTYGNRELFPEAQLFALRIPDDFDRTDMLLKIADRFHLNLPLNKVLSGNALAGIKREFQIEEALGRALVEDHFEVYYQPIWEVATKRFRSAEALLRLHDELLGEIPPDEFIPIAENNGMIVEIGQVMLKKVCAFVRQSDLRSIGVQFIDINLSIVQCMVGNFTDSMTRIMQDYGVPANVINFEITEAASRENYPGLHQTIQTLHSIGSGFSLDDFGTGYSNLSAVVQMDFDNIKIDKSVLWDADENKNANILLREVIKTLQNMNRKIVVEGVETEWQKQKLLDFGCDYLQGFYFSRPLESGKFVDFVKEYNLSAAEEED